MNNFLVPPLIFDENGNERRVGFEIEFSGVSLEKVVEIIKNIYNGKEKYKNKYISEIETYLGVFRVELDFKLIKQSLLRKELKEELENFLKISNLEIEEFLENIEDFIASISKIFIPYEVVTPPIKITQLDKLIALETALRENGAVGTDASILYGFGLHINPQTPSFKVETILSYLRAFLCLYEWLLEKNKVDLTRRLLPFIKPFEKDYILLVLNRNYRPKIDKFINDYLEYNPTRNRPLDLLPLLAFINEKKVKSVIKGEKLSIRPTYHYRLPDSRIDTLKYNLAYAWNNWIEVEKLSFNKEKLENISQKYIEYLNNPLNVIFNNWSEQLEVLLNE